MDVQPTNNPPFEDTERTPGWLRDFVAANFTITFEPETALQNPLGDAWQGFSFAHPPHSEAQQWCEKAAFEARRGNFSVLLLPAVFNSCYWRSCVYPEATEIRVFTCPVCSLLLFIVAWLSNQLTPPF